MSNALQGTQLHNEIVRRHRSGSSKRSIARSLGISRYQVERILAAHRKGREQGTTSLPKPQKKRASCLDDYQQPLAQLLERYPDITAVRMHEEIQKLGFSGSYSIVKRRLRQMRPRKIRDFVQRFETAPGQQAQMDYSPYTIDFTDEGRRRVHAFSYLLGYSRCQYVHFVESQDFTTTIRQHIEAFEYLRGVAATCLYDNFKVVVTGYDGEEPVYNTRFLAFATHYGYRPVACRPRRSQTKGKVERPFFYVEKNLLNGRTFRSLAHLNDVTAKWLKEVADVRIHRETKQRPVDRLAEEAPHLMPLPAHAYDTAEVVYRCVSAEGLIAYGQNRYSVPWRHIGLTLPVRVTETEVIIYGPQIEEIARHALIPRHLTSQTVRLKIHQPSDDSEKKYEVLKRRYEELGEAAGRFFAEIVKRRRYGKAEAHKILSLLETYHRQDLLAAIERAVRYGAYSQRAIERILAVTATPKTALDRLAEKEQKQLDALLEDRSVQPRSGKEYQQMFDNPSDNQIDDSTDNQTDDSTDHEKQTDNQSPADEPTDFRDEESPGSAEDSESS